MKKFIVCLVAVFAFAMSLSSCFADELRIERESEYQKRVMEVGFRILNANQIEKRMTFYYAPSKVVNASAHSISKQITIYKGILPYMDSDDELAGILSHEIVHGLDFHKGLWRRLSMNGKTKSYEFKADKNAVDLMVNAGYNPVAMIIILNKICEEPNWFEISKTHPNGLARMVNIYGYIYTKYPSYLIDNEYKNNLYFQNFLLTTKQERKFIKENQLRSNTTTPVNNITRPKI